MIQSTDANDIPTRIGISSRFYKAHEVFTNDAKRKNFIYKPTRQKKESADNISSTHDGNQFANYIRISFAFGAYSMNKCHMNTN